MPGEEYPHVSPGGSQWERVSDAEAAVVFNQRTWGTLQLPAQQVIWEVINIEGHPNWSKKQKMHDWSLFASISCQDSLEFLLFTSTNSFFMIVFCKPTLHWTHKCPDVYFRGDKCVLLKHWRWFHREVQSFCAYVRRTVCVHEMIRMYEMNVCLYFFSGFSSLVYCFDLCVNQSLHQDTVSTAPYMHIPSTFMPHSYASH